MRNVIAKLNEEIRRKLPFVLQPRTMRRSGYQFYFEKSDLLIKKIADFFFMQHNGNIHGLGSLDNE